MIPLSLLRVGFCPRLILRSHKKRKLEPGECSWWIWMLVVSSMMLKLSIAREKPYHRWLNDSLVNLKIFPLPLMWLMIITWYFIDKKYFGYTFEDIAFVELKCSNWKQPLGSMNDSPWQYFKEISANLQLFLNIVRSSHESAVTYSKKLPTTSTNIYRFRRAF